MTPWRTRAVNVMYAHPSRLSGLVAVAVVTAFAMPAVAENIQGLPHAFDAGWQGQKTCELLFEDDSVRVGRCVFPPGVGHEKHYHNPHFGYTLSGSKMRLSDASGEREVVSRKGSTWSTEAVTVHEALNIGDSDASYLIVEPRPNP